MIQIIKILIVVAIYLIPTIVAYSRKHKNKFSIYLTNLLLGWTGLGWIIALIWSFTN